MNDKNQTKPQDQKAVCDSTPDKECDKHPSCLTCPKYQKPRYRPV